MPDYCIQAARSDAGRFISGNPMAFSTFGLAEEILRAVTERGYTEPTPVQVQAIPAVLSGQDLLAGAQTGTGKTAGFVLPLLQLLSRREAMPPAGGRARAPVRALILTPTRELAAQVEESVRAYGKYVKLSSMVMFGGVNINPQIERLRGRVDILVATPGRLLDHVQQRTLDLSRVEILVLDEADRMLDMGFIRDIKRILALLPKRRQNLLFSATFSAEIKALADSLLNRPAMIEVAFRTATADLIAQKVVRVDRARKRELLSHLIKEHRWFQVLVFMRTKHGANKLAEQLGKDGIAALAIHGNKSQGARTRALAEFKDGSLQVLVATDIAARGLDIVDLPHVVNFELPNVPEDYVHRIGRTGRAGAAGEAISLVCVDEDRYLADIEKLTKRPIPVQVIRGFEPDPRIKAEPILMGGQRGPRGTADAGHGRPAARPAPRPARQPGHRAAPRGHAAAAGPRSPGTRNPGYR
jgi:ATP-dependent RNA helicase RhlE